ncbi:thiamine-phosphate diphosphorylase [Haloactinopolyspora alba]|uniref:Thiamine-phosphate synthase n=1 Tax=Haloactinopolyspora alba TaxID=648780 RepID=A0A2P8EFX9_9ACTN|nr:thiamine phosphate synthase [Haloactinopolyspora alba]PSL08375.1 thiamine-phosphate diphosphorylase [Haloactinopolyspora alba]
MSVMSGESRRRRLAEARLYLCTDARRDRADLESFLHAALAGGVDIVQLRDKTLDAADELAAHEIVRGVAAEHDALVAVNDRADLALLAAADVFHTGQTDLPVPASRQLLGDDVMLGRSTHSPEQAAAAEADNEIDYFCVGPVWPTPTKQGRPAVGLDTVETVARTSPATPWFAIGGVDETTVDAVIDAGARRAVVVRAITEAADPESAARRLAQRLRAAGRG